VVTANKGPIAHAYAELRDEAARAGVGFRFEAAAMDGAPVFNLWHYNLPGVKVLGFTGALNSTSKVVVEAMERGGSFEDGLKAARAAREGASRCACGPKCWTAATSWPARPALRT
jgi:homoserine dehydrogenase